MRVVRGLAAILSGSLLGLAACSDGGDDPVVLPSGTTQPTTPTPTESTTVPSSTSEPTPTTTLVLPETQVPEADAFVREFFDAYNAAQDSGDFSAFDAMYLPQCAGCIQMRDELEGWLADDATVNGADWIIQQVSSLGIVDNAGTTVLAYRTPGAIEVDGSSSPIPLLTVQLFNVNVQQADGWIIQDLAFGEAS